jgi:hypothetical protein
MALPHTKPLVQTISDLNALNKPNRPCNYAVLSTSYLPSALRPFIEYLNPGIILSCLAQRTSLFHTRTASLWHKLQIRGIAGDEYGDYQ